MYSLFLEILYLVDCNNFLNHNMDLENYILFSLD